MRKINWFALLTSTSLFFGGLLGYYSILYVAVICYIPSATVTVPYRGLFLLFTLWLSSSYFFKRRPFYSGKLLFVFFAFWILYAVAILLEPSGYLYQSKLKYGLMALGGCVLPSLPLLFRMQLSELNIGWITTLITGIAVGMCSLFLYGDAQDIGRAQKGEFIGDFVTIGPLQLSYIGSVSMLLGLHCAIEGKALRLRILRYGFATALLILGAFQVSIGASRGAVVAIVVVVLLFVGARLRTFRDMSNGALLLSLLIVGGSLVSYYSDVLGSVLFMRLQAILHVQDTYMHGGHGIGRIFIYQASIEQFLENPFFGGGLTVRSMDSYSHNFLLEAFLSTGVFGGMLFSVFFFGSLWRALLIIRYVPQCSWVSVLFLHYSVSVQFSSSLASNTYFWFTAMLVLGVYEFSGVKMQN